MVDEAVRRSSQVPSSVDAADVRRKLSRYSVAALVDLMAPMDERGSLTADDFFDRKSRTMPAVTEEGRSQENEDGSSVVDAPVLGATARSRCSPTDVARAEHRRASFAEQVGAQPLGPSPRRRKQRSKRVAAMQSILSKPEGWDYSRAASILSAGAAPPAKRPLTTLTVDEVQRLLACWGLECFAAELYAEAADGEALNDIDDLQDLDDFSTTNRRQRKKLVRLISIARADGVALPEH